MHEQEIVFHFRWLMPGKNNYDSLKPKQVLRSLAIQQKSIEFLKPSWLYLYVLFPLLMPFALEIIGRIH